MPQNKNIVTIVNDNLSQLAAQIGLVLMTAATVTGMLELPTHTNNRVVLPGQASYAMVTDENGELNNPIRREKEEAAPHYISYTETQRTASRSSKK